MALDEDNDQALRAFVTARVDEAETADRERGLALWERPWERRTAVEGSTRAVQLIASTWATHPEFRPQWTFSDDEG